MVELDTRIIPAVTDSISHWRRYVDDTFVFIKKGYVPHVLVLLNSFHKNIQFTYELVNQNKLPFLDVLSIRRGNKIETTVYRKNANNAIQSNADGAPTVENELPSNSKSFALLLLYTGQKGEHLIRSLKKGMHRTLPENVQTRIYYTGTKLGTKFDEIKHPIKKSHQHHVVYYDASLKPSCVEDYTGETGRIVNERVIDLNGRDKK